jgi:hypothetical protein
MLPPSRTRTPSAISREKLSTWRQQVSIAEMMRIQAGVIAALREDTLHDRFLADMSLRNVLDGHPRPPPQAWPRRRPA